MWQPVNPVNGLACGCGGLKLTCRSALRELDEAVDVLAALAGRIEFARQPEAEPEAEPDDPEHPDPEPVPDGRGECRGSGFRTLAVVVPRWSPRREPDVQVTMST